MAGFGWQSLPAGCARVPAVLAVALTTFTGIALCDVRTLADESGVRVTKSTTEDAWQIANDLLEVDIGFDQDHRLAIRRLTYGGRNRLAAVLPDGSVTVGGQVRALANDRRAGIPLVAAGVEGHQGGLRLWLRFEAAGVPAITRSYACYGGLTVLEIWSDVAAPTGSYLVEFSPVLQVAVPGRRVGWTRGIRPEDGARPFRGEEQWMSAGTALAIGGTGRSTATALPLLSARHLDGVVFAGLAWSGAWSGRATRQGESTHLQLGLAGGPIVIAGARARPLPRAFLGVAEDKAGMSRALRRFVVEGLRGGRGFEALITYNTWFAHGTSIDAAVIAREMETAASLGIELFQLDAGWYEGAGLHGASDFDSGLGSWAVDRERFPEGLRPLGEYARSLGMRFGAWAEPERVDLALVGREGGVAEPWLASAGGVYLEGRSNETTTAGLICLSHPEARTWVIERLSAFIDEEGVDYLKWDSNFWLNCDREGHGHDRANGNAAHVQGLYEVLDALRGRFPHLLIENCAGGGFRLDYGLVRYTDAAWMDDQSAPSSRVRAHLQGLGPVVPPGYLLSYAMAGGGEALSLRDDLGAIVRSRMAGVLGFTYRAGEIDDDLAAALAGEVALFRQVRDVVRDGAAIVLAPQSADGLATDDPPAWEALEIVTDAGHAVVFVHQNDAALATWRLVPRGLHPAATYEVVVMGYGPLGTATGEALMADGFEVSAQGDSAAQVVALRPLQGR